MEQELGALELHGVSAMRDSSIDDLLPNWRPDCSGARSEECPRYTREAREVTLVLRIKMAINY